MQMRRPDGASIYFYRLTPCAHQQPPQTAAQRTPVRRPRRPPRHPRSGPDAMRDAAAPLRKSRGADTAWTPERQIPGISALSAHALIGEIGTTLDKFPSVRHFASWLGLCPDNQICQRPPALPIGLYFAQAISLRSIAEAPSSAARRGTSPAEPSKSSESPPKACTPRKAPSANTSAKCEGESEPPKPSPPPRIAERSETAGRRLPVGWSEATANWRESTTPCSKPEPPTTNRAKRDRLTNGFPKQSAKAASSAAPKNKPSNEGKD